MMLLEPPQSGMQRQSLLIYYISNLVMVGVKFNVGCFDQLSTVVNSCQLFLLNVVNCCQLLSAVFIKCCQLLSTKRQQGFGQSCCAAQGLGEQGLEVRLLLQELQQANLELQQPLAKPVDQP